MVGMMQRAYSQDQKSEKRLEILMSAEDLYLKEKGKFPTVNAICLYSSMAKGTVYLYFKSKEEIYLALIEDYFHQWMDPKNIKESISNIDQVMNLIIGFVEGNNYKFNLMNRRHFLETECRSEVVIDFQTSIYSAFAEYSATIATELGQPIERVRQWLHDVYFYIQGLWRTLSPSEEMKVAIKESSLKDFYFPNFRENAERVMKVLWEHSALENS